jgi:glycosyltransferase involved in cell wall biosynthesis
MAGADVFVHPSRWEGVSQSVLEAAAWERPCLLTRAADPAGALGRGGAVVVVQVTREGLAGGIRTHATMDRARLVTMGRLARRVVERGFNWPTTAQRVVDAYRLQVHG